MAGSAHGYRRSDGQAFRHADPVGKETRAAWLVVHNLPDFAATAPATCSRVRQTAGTTLLVRQRVLDHWRSSTDRLFFPTWISILYTPATGIPRPIKGEVASS